MFCEPGRSVSDTSRLLFETLEASLIKPDSITGALMHRIPAKSPSCYTKDDINDKLERAPPDVVVPNVFDEGVVQMRQRPASNHEIKIIATATCVTMMQFDQNSHREPQNLLGMQRHDVSL